MYVYGGYEVNEGILSDFYSMVIKNAQSYKWEKISNKGNKPYPGPLMRHTAVVFQDKMYIFGGNKQSLKSTNDIWTYDYIYDEWQNVEPKDQIKPLEIDSHCATVDDTRACMYIFGGFSNARNGGYQDKLWQFNFDSFSWQEIGEQSKQKPSKRAGASITILGQAIYMFGGTIVDKKFNDIWKFNTHENQWEQIEIQENSIQPETRNGHILINFKDNLIIFGGIHDITHEKNDLYVFAPHNKQWHIIDDDISHIQKREDENNNTSCMPFQDNAKNLSADQTLNTSKLNYEENHNLLNKQQHSSNKQLKNYSFMGCTPIFKKNYKSILKGNDTNIIIKEVHNTSKNINQMKENRKKKFQIKKRNLLQEFELNETEKLTFRNNSPTTETMKNSIVSVGNPIGKNKNSLKIQDQSKTNIQQQFDFKQNKVMGRRPCARDGHSAIICDNQCFIFGGDRHLMAYNDIYIVDLDKIINSLLS
ncbi:kelch motif family protein, putative [Ichthyophthirius multifiliis]|uniref:Kelch motif family protein, putative n=1 Tax=Ichthyophthirius multifiliis TaxID=5932 RepID=G0QZR0_ICHMU|nr:kelch motif family protein, putative [Ichthyophthirius multifiliis]EGR29299.1 kelch motif family protein, putative [Ichthyophthirius multifiliis]|eukprot:XP_004030535.1 kelch motif family protein, putative [Ichthyophthirius multifiliis]